jgi:hypothetical protein
MPHTWDPRPQPEKWQPPREVWERRVQIAFWLGVFVTSVLWLAMLCLLAVYG